MSHALNIKVYTFCYNLELILPFVIEYWKQYATSVVVYDNMSTDNSVNILSKYSWIEVRQFDTNDKYNPNRILEIKNKCVHEANTLFGVDYVMICDLDEVLYCYDNLMTDLQSAKSADIKVFTSVYYNAVSKFFPRFTDKLILDMSGIGFAKSINTNKVLLFDPSINISFSNLLHSCTYDDSVKSAQINVLHMKLIGINRYINELLNIANRIDNPNRSALVYGADLNTCASLFNNTYARTYQRLYNVINTRIIASSIQSKSVPSIKTQSTGTIKINKDMSFKDMVWTNTSILYNTRVSNNNLIIAIPVYKEKLDKSEEKSLCRLIDIVKTSYNIVFVAPDGLNMRNYRNICQSEINVLKVNNNYFTSRNTYSYLCETAQFYECFFDYKYVMIYQLDGWIFKNDLERFIKMDYDYIGAPWKLSLAIPRTVGNGGVSLRKVSKFIEICKSIKPSEITRKNAAQIEDLFFCLYVKGVWKDKFNIAPVEIGLEFCIDKDPGYWMNTLNGKFPMCIHALPKNYYYWENRLTEYDKKFGVKKEEPKFVFAKKDEGSVTKNADNLKVALCAIAKNENRYIREWVEYYKSIGITKIYLYDNNEINGEHFEEVINDYIQNGFVKVINKRGIEKGLVYDESGVNLLPACYCDCYETFGKDYDWMCFFDIDEFINFREHYKSIQEFLKSNLNFNKFDTILVPWETYDDNDKLIYENKPVRERFTRVSSIYKKYIVKSIVRTKQKMYKDLSINCLIHCFLTANETICNVNGDKIKNNNSNWYIYKLLEFNKAVIVLNHYKTKSIEEFFSRLLGRHWGTGRQHTNTPIDINKCIENFYMVNNKTKLKEDFIKNNYILLSNIVDVYMASIWRAGHVIESIKSIINQKEVKTITLSANNFTNELILMVKDQIMNNKLIIKKTKNEKCSMEKLRFVSEGTAKYVAFCDDDLIYCENYFKMLIENCESLNAAVTMHGSILPSTLPILSYYKDKKTLPYMSKLEATTKVDILGNGVSLFKRSFLTKLQYIDLYEKSPNISMDDITVSYELRKSGYDLYVLKHNGKEVISKKAETTDKSTYLLYENNCPIQTNWINENFNKLK